MVTSITSRWDLTVPPGRAIITAVMALAMPLVHQFAAEIAKLPPEEQTKRIAKVLAAMRGDA
jgi:hypothetical protein